MARRDTTPAGEQGHRSFAEQQFPAIGQARQLLLSMQVYPPAPVPQVGQRVAYQLAAGGLYALQGAAGVLSAQLLQAAFA